jgi:hypothetical protein
MHSFILRRNLLPARIRARVGPPHPFVRLNGAVLHVRPEKPRPRVTAGVG